MSTDDSALPFPWTQRWFRGESAEKELANADYSTGEEAFSAISRVRSMEVVRTGYVSTPHCRRRSLGWRPRVLLPGSISSAVVASVWPFPKPCRARRALARILP